jgi:quinol monooxygenase YgiN
MAYVLAVKITAAPGDEDRLCESLRRITALTRQEAGCMLFLLHRDKSNQRVFFIYERFTDRSAHDAHLETEHFKHIAEVEVMPRAAGFELTELEPL